MSRVSTLRSGNLLDHRPLVIPPSAKGTVVLLVGNTCNVSFTLSFVFYLASFFSQRFTRLDQFCSVCLTAVDLDVACWVFHHHTALEKACSCMPLQGFTLSDSACVRPRDVICALPAKTWLSPAGSRPITEEAEPLDCRLGGPELSMLH